MDAEYLKKWKKRETMCKHEEGGLKMDTNELKELFGLIKARERICNTIANCKDCPLRYKLCCFDDCYEDIADLDRLIRTIKEWDAAHPALEEVGKGIYYDPKHRIVPDEITRVFTIEVTCVDKDGRIWDEEKVKRWREVVVTQWLEALFPDAADVKCVRAQQFITKCHEEVNDER